MEQVDKYAFLAEGLQSKMGAALGSVMRHPVQIELGHVGVVPLAEVQKIAGADSLVSIYIPLVGDVVGDIFFFADVLSATTMADLMIGNATGTTSVIGEFESSALKELGNIISGVIVTELANRMGVSIMLTIPNFANGFVAAMIDQVLISYSESSNHAFAIRLPFTIEGHLASGFFLLLFTQESSKLLEDKLGGQGV